MYMYVHVHEQDYDSYVHDSVPNLKIGMLSAPIFSSDNLVSILITNSLGIPPRRRRRCPDVGRLLIWNTPLSQEWRRAPAKPKHR